MTRPDFALRPAATFALLALLAAAPALAQEEQPECATDADCGHGFMCETGTYAACPDIAPVCEGDMPCPAPPECEEMTYAYCVIAPCEQDSDCPDGMSCESNTYEQCDWEDIACADGEECPAPEPTNCMDITEQYCAAPWELPCTQDSDCGEGFDCVEAESCSCGGSAGSPPPDDGSDPQPLPAEEPDCGCTPSGEFYCAQQEIVCADDSDCPASWTCESSNLRVACAVPAGPDGGEPMTTDCGGNDAPELTCQPPYSSRGGSFATSELASKSGAQTLGAPQADGVGNEGGAADGDDAAGTMEAATNSGSSAGGCAVSALAPASASSAWLLALGLLAIRRRRR